MKKMVIVTHTVGDKTIREEIESGVNEIIVWKIGDKDRPATEEDINALVEALTEGMKDIDNELFHLLTHHAVAIERVKISDVEEYNGDGPPTCDGPGCGCNPRASDQS